MLRPAFSAEPPRLAAAAPTRSISRPTMASARDATQTFTLTVDQAAAITSATSTTFVAGTCSTFSLGDQRIPAPTFSENRTDTLPSGVTFNAATGALSGTPAVGAVGVYTLHFTAHNGIGSDATQTFTLTVGQAPSITSASNTTFTPGVAGNFTVVASGSPAPTLSESGTDTLPSGVTFNAATGASAAHRRSAQAARIRCTSRRTTVSAATPRRRSR